jgi:DnaJ-class molecular chaperone
MGALGLIWVAVAVIAVYAIFFERTKSGDCPHCRGHGFHFGPGMGNWERVKCWHCKGTGKKR